MLPTTTTLNVFGSKISVMSSSYNVMLCQCWFLIIDTICHIENMLNSPDSMLHCSYLMRLCPLTSKLKMTLGNGVHITQLPGWQWRGVQIETTTTAAVAAAAAAAATAARIRMTRRGMHLRSSQASCVRSASNVSAILRWPALKNKAQRRHQQQQKQQQQQQQQ
uniref:Uncharacterized protein n=1 Tax=Glossina austeni TaxID=7395 RepID=A0A1A9VCT6_GLOAU